MWPLRAIETEQSPQQITAKDYVDVVQQVTKYLTWRNQSTDQSDIKSQTPEVQTTLIYATTDHPQIDISRTDEICDKI